MALVHAIGVGILDYTGNKKSITIYQPATVALATVQTDLNTYLPLIDAAIDGKIVDAQVTIALTLPGGLKGAAVTGNTVREGALEGYSAASTAFKFSYYVPSWSNAGFAGNSVINTGAYGSANAAPVGVYSDKDANLLTAFISGRRTFRK